MTLKEFIRVAAFAAGTALVGWVVLILPAALQTWRKR